jgi:hypothetical protein
MTAVAIVIGVVAAMIVWAVWGEVPAKRRRARVAGASELPAQAERLDRLVRAGVRHAEGVHHQLRPLLAAAVEPALTRRGLALDPPDPRAEAVLGPELWEIVRPDRPRPVDQWGPGLDRHELERILDRLELLSATRHEGPVPSDRGTGPLPRVGGRREPSR